MRLSFAAILLFVHKPFAKIFIVSSYQPITYLFTNTMAYTAAVVGELELTRELVEPLYTNS